MKALIAVDIQNDFCPGGALPVPNGDEVVAITNRLMRLFPIVVATRDWHPEEHMSFASSHEGASVFETVTIDGCPQTLWPDHCKQGTWGAEFAPGLDTHRIDEVIFKGTDRKIDSYSGFFDNRRLFKTNLDAYLKSRGVDEVWVTGLAIPYCPKFTALDAVSLGFKTHLVFNACRGIDVPAGAVAKAVEEMEAAGIAVITLDFASAQAA